MRKLQTAKKKYLTGVLKFIVAFVAYGYIFVRLREYSLHDFVPAVAHTKLSVLAFLLMPLNWFIEALKWRFLVRKIHALSVKTSFKAVMTGVTAAVFTPNRIGELGGRVVVLPKEKRLDGVFATAAGSLGQLTVTLLNGTVALLLFLVMYSYRSLFSDKTYLLYALIFILIVSLTVFYSYFNLMKISVILSRIRFFKKITKNLNVLAGYSYAELIKVLLLSFVRYTVFFFQFFFFLLVFDVQISISEAYLSIALSYFVMAALPSITVAEIGIRGSVALFFVGFFSGESIGIILASTLLWVVNLAIPAIAGSWFLLRTKL